MASLCMFNLILAIVRISKRNDGFSKILILILKTIYICYFSENWDISAT